MARLSLHASPDELREKAPTLLAELAQRLLVHAPEVARAVLDALGHQSTQRRVAWRRLAVTIENEPGTVRHGITMQFPYGFIHSARGADGDRYDCFLGPDPKSAHVFVIRQLKPDGTYDEDKAFLDFTTAHDAKAAFLAHAGDAAFGGLVVLSVDEFKAKLKQTKDGMIKSVAPAATTPPPRFVLKSLPFPSPESVTRVADNFSTGALLVTDAPRPPLLQVPVSELGWSMHREDRLETARALGDAAVRFVVTRADPVRPVEVDPIQEEFAEELRENAPDVLARLDAKREEIALAPMNNLVTMKARRGRPPVVELPAGVETRVAKRGYGSVLLKSLGHAVVVTLPDTTTHTFPSLTSAADFVWCRQRGYADAQSYKAATGAARVPSGAGRRFWGLA